MTRLTTKDSIMGRKHDIKCGCASVWKTKLKNYRYELIEDVVDKLGELEDILEKHYILTFEELEICIENGEKTLDEFVKWRENRFCELVKPYKDIEEELGIDLTTLFKALKNSMWYKHYDEKSNENRIWNAHCYMKPLLNVYNKTIEIKEYVDNAGGYWYVDKDVVYLKDYGKTWALTKEELENE